MLNIALPKGRLGRCVYGLLEQVGYCCDGVAGERVTALTEAPAGGRFARTVDLRKEGASC